jgi:hypothetical protein
VSALIIAHHNFSGIMLLIAPHHQLYSRHPKGYLSMVMLGRERLGGYGSRITNNLFDEPACILRGFGKVIFV